MVKVTFLRDSDVLETELSVGERIFDAGQKLNLNETDGFGECGGNCSCATCHVYVEQGGDLFDGPFPLEEELLDTAFRYRTNSRLACQLLVKDGMEHVVVRLPETC